MKEATGVPQDILSVGDTVTWKGRFGKDVPQRIKILYIIITPEAGGTRIWGTNVDSIPYSKLIGQDILLGIDKGLWAYGSQITKEVL